MSEFKAVIVYKQYPEDTDEKTIQEEQEAILSELTKLIGEVIQLNIHKLNKKVL